MPKPRRAICIYMMKKALFMLAMLTCIFASCSDGGSDEPSNPTPKPEEVKSEITLDNGIVTNGLSFGVAQGEQSVSFTTNTNWTLSIAATTGGSTWCKASATSGSKGTASVKFTVTENTDYDDRSVSVTIKAGTASKTFTITQKGADALLVTTKKYEVAQAGGKIEVEVKANIEYQLAISETAKDWIKETQSKSRALTTKKHTFQIAENEEVEKREGEITIKSGDKVETVKVYQAGGAVLLLSKNEFTVSDAGETISVDIKSNVEYGVQMPDVDWIKDEASNRGMSSHTLKYVIAPNEGYDSRSAEIIFYDQNSDLKDTLKVVQAQKDAIVISKKEYEVKAEGETIEVKLSANVDFEVTMPEVDWIEQVSSRALKEHTLYLKVAKHEGEESRSAEIVFMDKDSQLSDSITIIQNPPRQAGYADGTVTIAKAGTMKKLLGDDYLSITSLKVVGPINGDDIYYLRKMMEAEGFSTADCGKLTELDLSEASIVKGGSWYYVEQYSNNEHYTSDNTIGYKMFSKCNLKHIVLPKNITKIEYQAFMESASLTSVVMHEGITSIGADAFFRNESLDNVTIPETVVEIGAQAFAFCPLRFYRFIIPDSVKRIGMFAFISNRFQHLSIGKGLTTIDDAVFVECKDLRDVTIPNTVKTIGARNFSHSGQYLHHVTIGDSVTLIGSEAFSDCKYLFTITIGKNVKTIQAGAFDNTRISQCTIYATTPPTLEEYKNKHAFTNAIEDKAKLYVPAKCANTYYGWAGFYNIIEMEE